jgi:2-polyprenyl-3-methyl-5-hydroxy-6-metoxy-1,4-benzoquinol methylase
MSPPSLRFVLAGKPVEVEPGGMALEPQDSLYRDAPDQLLTQILADITAGVPWREASARHLASGKPWLHRIVTDPARVLWLKSHPPRADSWVLDVGAGWGQWAVPAAASARVVALEPNPARLAVIRAIAEQEHRSDHLYFLGASLGQVEFPERRFDQIYCIGVLEWVPKFSSEADPLDAQRGFLRRLGELLAPDGECLIGIENRLGLKYLLGARDDHTGLASISCLDATSAAQGYRTRTGQPLRVFTHTMAEYERLLREAGFARTEFLAAFPDYKVPAVILPVADGSANRHCLSEPVIPEHHGNDGAPLPFPENLASHYRTLAALGIAGLFAPSFFIRAWR